MQGALFYINLIIHRGVGALCYAIVATLWIPSSNFIDVVKILPLVEFVSGMLLPVFRTSIVSGKISSGFSFVISALAGLLIFLYILFISDASHKYVFISLVVLALVPMVICASADLERESINQALKIEAASSLFSSLAAACAILLGSYFDSMDFLVTPLIRPALYMLLYIALIGIAGVSVSIKFTKAKAGSLWPLRGIDYLLVISIVKINMLESLRILSSGEHMIKGIMIVYDVCAAFLGYYLRSTFSSAGFEYKKYRESNQFLFLILIFFSIGALILSKFLMPDLSVVSASFYVFGVLILFLIMAGMTTAVIVGYFIDYLFVVVLFICGFVIDDFFEAWLMGVYYGFILLTALVNFYSKMFKRFFCNCSIDF